MNTEQKVCDCKFPKFCGYLHVKGQTTYKICGECFGIIFETVADEIIWMANGGRKACPTCSKRI